MESLRDFNREAWVAALCQSFTEGIRSTMRDFQEELAVDDTIDAEKLAACLQGMEQNMLWSMQVNIDRLEGFYDENSVQNDGQYIDLLRSIENRSTVDANYQERVDSVFKEIQQSCVEHAEKKQKFLKYCLYDKYLDKERALTATAGDQNGEYFDMRVREEQIHIRARQNKEFLREFSSHIDLFGGMQTDLLRKLQ